MDQVPDEPAPAKPTTKKATSKGPKDEDRPKCENFRMCGNVLKKGEKTMPGPNKTRLCRNCGLRYKSVSRAASKERDMMQHLRDFANMIGELLRS